MLFLKNKVFIGLVLLLTLSFSSFAQTICLDEKEFEAIISEKINIGISNAVAEAVRLERIKAENEKVPLLNKIVDLEAAIEVKKVEYSALDTKYTNLKQEYITNVVKYSLLSFAGGAIITAFSIFFFK